MSIRMNYQRIRAEIPGEVSIVVAAKTRTVEEIRQAISAGATDFGENYVQEAVEMHRALGEAASQVRWHMIGHLQKNKITKALRTCDVLQTVDSLEKAAAIDKRVEATGRAIVPVLVQINIGNEESKAGVVPEAHEPFEPYMEGLVRDISQLKHVRLEGFMTMGPRFGDPEDSRPYFRRTKALFDRIKEMGLPNVNMTCLSMGMTNSYRVAIDEGSNMVRIGTAVFGDRKG